MEKCHAVIALFTVGRSLDRDECCVVNFSDRCSAKAAFKVKLDLKGLKRVCRKCGHDVVEERVLKGYPFYCPRCYENKFSFETEFAIDESKEKEESNGQD